MADQETRDYLIDSEKRCRELLNDRRIELKRLAEGLLEYETLSKDEIEKIVNGEKIDKLKVISNKI
ncbi:hypothetical protein B9K06_27195, partial [Bacillus sp. OG2]